MYIPTHMYAADTHLDAEKIKNTTPTRVLPSFASFGVAGYTNPNPAPAEPSAETDADVEALTDELAMEFMGEYLTGDSWALQILSKL